MGSEGVRECFSGNTPQYTQLVRAIEADLLRLFNGDLKERPRVLGKLFLLLVLVLVFALALVLVLSH